MSIVTMRICAAEDCNNRFEPKIGKQIYCSQKCKDRVKARKYRKLRLKQNKCPQCGGEMDYPISVHRNKTSTAHCSKCQTYYHERYITKK